MPRKRITAQRPKPKRGRPPKDVSAHAVLELARIGCTQEEMATILDCSIDTLQRNFAAEMQRGKVELCGSLRKAQIKKAIQGANPQMQIWLGKQLLKQTNGSLELTGPEGAPL